MFYQSNLIYLMEKSNMKKIRLAEKLEISRQAITDLLKVNDPKASTLIKLSKIFNVSIDDLLLKDLSE